MTPLLIQVQCNLASDNPQWNEINDIRLEVGYPGRSGKILWKHIAWLNDNLFPAGKGIAHAIWNQATAGLVLIFDFLPVLETRSDEVNKTYRFRKSIMAANGQMHSSKSRILKGDYRDEHITLSPQYPDLEKAQS